MVDWIELAVQLGYEEPRSMLRDLYLVKGMSTQEIGRLLGVTGQSIKNKLDQYQIPLRGRGGKRWRYAPIEHISLEDYQRMTYQELAERYKCSSFKVYQLTRGYPRKKAGRRPKKVSQVHPPPSGTSDTSR